MKVRVLGLASVIALAFVVAGCSKQASQPAEQPTAAPAAPAATVNPATAGEITGTVKFVGTPPRMPIIRMGADPGCVKDSHGKLVHSEQVVVGKDGALANVVVFIKSGLGNYSYTTPTTAATLDQKGCMYQPHVVTMMVDQPLNVINSDSFTHNIHVMPKDNPQWNEAQTAGAAPIVKTFHHAEMAIPVRCNIHPWMQAYVCVFANPYFSTTGDDGTFTIKNVPPGTYTIEAWQEKYGTQDEQVTVGASQTQKVDFSFKAQ